MAYGTIKVDTITFTNAGSDQSITVSGIVQSISGNITATGTIQGQTIIGTSTVSGATVTGNVGSFTTLTGGTVTLTSGVFASGTAAAPSVSIGTTTNGLYSPGTNQVAISTSGSGRLFVDASGRVGVNTSTPERSLGVWSATNDDGIQIRNTSTAASVNKNSRLQFVGTDTLGTAKGTANIYCVAADQDLVGAHLSFWTRGSDLNAERLRITSAGLVGIGTNSPVAGSLLDVTGGAVVCNKFFWNRISSAETTATRGLLFTIDGTDYGRIYSPNGKSVAIQAGSGSLTDALTIDTTGRVGIGTVTPGQLLEIAAASNPQMRFTDTGDYYYDIGITSSNKFSISPAGSPALTVVAAGNVGIGTSSPNTRLHVSDGEFTISTGGNAADAGGIINFGITTYTAYSPMATVQGLLANATGTELQGGLGFFTRPSGTAGQSLARRMTITAAGNVGIGTTSPAHQLDVVNDSGDSVIRARSGNGASLMRLRGSSAALAAFNAVISSDNVDTVHWYLGGDGSQNTLVVKTNNTERARIDSSGRLLVGTASSVFGSLVQSSSTGGAQYEGARFSADSFGPALTLIKSRGASVGTNTAVQQDDILGIINFRGANGSDYSNVGAQILAAVDGAVSGGGANDMPGRLVFSTTADGASSPTERARITSDGYVRLTSSSPGIQFNGDTAAANALNDYEEGTFTPTVVGGTTAGTATYSSQAGIYRKIGTLVHISLKLTWTGGTGTGTLQVGGLPFNVNTTYLPVFSVLAINVALTASNVISGFSNLTAGIQLVQTPVGGGSDTTVTYDSAGSLYITGTYVAS